MASALKRIVVTRRLPEGALRHLNRPDIVCDIWNSDEPIPKAELANKLSDSKGTHGLVCMLSETLDSATLKLAPDLKVVSTMSVGHSHIDTSYCKSKGIRIGYTPGVLTDATADLALALTLATARRIPEAHKAVHTGDWSSWKPFWMTGKPLSGAKVGIIGPGRIGSAIAKRFRGFGCPIAYHGRSGRKPDFEAECGGVAEYENLDTLLSTCDYVVLVCALTPETRGMINYEKLVFMKMDAVLINVARGEVVVQDDLIRVLQERPTFSAGLDVTTPEPLPTSSPLLSCPNCVVLPHIGSATTKCRNDMAEITVLNAIHALDNVPMVSELML